VIVMAMAELPDREMIIRDARQLVLFVDEQNISFPLGREKPQMQGGRYVSWDIPLSAAMIDRLKNAVSIGAGISPTLGIFSGFKGISTRDGRDKLARFLDGCMTPQQDISTTVPAIQPQTSGGPSDVEIGRRVAHNFDTQFKKAGMAGIRISVEACYASVTKSRKIVALEYCYLLDSVASGMDKAGSEQFSLPKQPFFLPENVARRTTSAFNGIRSDPTANEREITRWHLLILFVLSELDGIGKQ
jgi:hypothetical protein